jgi:predicted acylesterase/phospholipase RssA
MPTRQLNLVLQGGGVRGIAYVGVLKSLPVDVSLHTVAGTSAGSIVAALLALGRRSELESIMRRLDFSTLLDAAEQKRMARLKWAFGYNTASTSGFILTSMFLLRCACLWLRPLFDIGYLTRNRGLHQNDRLMDWLKEVFGEATFSDIKCEELYIVASDVSSRDFAIYSRRDHPTKKLCEAVLASVSIPLFFRPVTETDRVLVDGGMLSNFPSYLFERQEYRTLGLRLEGSKQKENLLSFGRYIGGLLNTMLEAHDKERTPQAHFTQFTINTGDISAIDFALSDAAKDALIESGRRTGARIPWNLVATTHPVLKFRDQHPDDILSWSLEQAGWAATAAESKNAWCEALEERLFMDYFFEEEWGTRVILQFDYQVKGDVPLFVRRFGLTTPPEGKGMMDFLPEFTSSPGPPEFNVHCVPWAANDERKGFIIMMVPPITEKSGRRGFTVRFRIQDDQREKLLGRVSDTFPLVSRCRARHHQFTGVARFWYAKNLGADIGVACPSTWSDVSITARSPYEEHYHSCGAFSVQHLLPGDVVNTFAFSRREHGAEFQG